MTTKTDSTADRQAKIHIPLEYISRLYKIALKYDTCPAEEFRNIMDAGLSAREGSGA